MSYFFISKGIIIKQFWRKCIGRDDSEKKLFYEQKIDQDSKYEGTRKFSLYKPPHNLIKIIFAEKIFLANSSL